ncbi:DUF2624 family protein [Pueribacillus sp. YX66]|uniref:DUF2624 family protein n=1 Tax=Pueribacillus sp. YX66 TaxID=3229242 RepID=UPI00358D4D77
MNRSFIQQIVNYKINHITPKELVQLAANQGIRISKNEAERVIAIVRSEKVNITNKKQINRLFLKIKKEVNPHAMKQVEQLLATYYKQLTDS